MEHRHIPLDGTPNMRDLGGIPTRCGRKTRHNKLFRSGTLSYLSDADWSTLARLNIEIICDFRADEEVDREPTRVPDSHSASVVRLEINPGNHRSFIKRAVSTENADNSALEKILVDINRMLATTCTPRYHEFLQQVAALPEDSALLFHCSAGKDRTGFAAAILLGLLNVERELIEQEYLLTQHYFLPERQLELILQHYPHYNWSEIDQRLLLPMLEVRKHYIGAALDALDEHWGGIDNYIREGLGIDDDERQRLQSLLLE